MRRGKKTAQESVDAMRMVGASLHIDEETLSRAETILRDVLNTDPELVRGRSYSVFEASAMIIAGRGTTKELRPRDVIAAYMEHSGLHIVLHTREIHDTIKMITNNGRLSVSTVEEYIDNIITSMKARPDLATRALLLWERIRDTRIANRYPRFVAATLIWMASEPKEINQKELSRVATTSDGTIRLIARDINIVLAGTKRKKLVFLAKKDDIDGT